MKIEIVDGLTLEQLRALREDDLASEPLDGTWLAASDSDGIVAGVARVFERDGELMLEDVWVDPPRRRAGIGRALVDAAMQRYPALWLICDEDMVDYYGSMGFASQPDLPLALCELNASKGYWQPSDHVHVAMRWTR